MSRLTASLLLLITAALWGITFVVQKWATLGAASLPPAAFTGLRFLLGALVITPLVWLESRRATTTITRSNLLGFCSCGTLMFLASWTQQRGIVETSVANAGFFTGVYVLWIPFFTWILQRHQPARYLWPAVGMTTAGIWLLNGASLTEFSRGDLWVLACSVFWALQIIAVGIHVTQSGRPLLLAWVQFLVTGVLGIMVTMVMSFTFSPFSIAQVVLSWRELLWAGVVSSGIAFTLQVVAQRYSPPAVAAVIMSSEMLFAALAGTLLLHEQLVPMQWLGGTLIFIAIVLVEAVPQWQMNGTSD